MNRNIAHPLLEVQNLSVNYPIRSGILQKVTGAVHAVENISFSVEQGKTLGLVGESGCGKTTAGRAILRLIEPAAGVIRFEGTDIRQLSPRQLRKLRPRMQMIFQDPYSSLNQRMPVGELIGEAVRVHRIVPRNQVNTYVANVMDSCGLPPRYASRYPHEFSGGQRQRICIARAIALRPRLIIADEPVSALDVSVQAQILNLLKDLQQEFGYSYLFISHDLSVVEYMADQVAVMYLGHIVEYASRSIIFERPLHPYTKALFSAVPGLDNLQSASRRIILTGDIPSPANPPSGCPFHTRCHDCMDICRTVPPIADTVGTGNSSHTVVCHIVNSRNTVNA